MSATLATKATTVGHMLRARIATARRAAHGDDGLVLIEWILLIGVVAVAVLAIAAIIVAKITAKANGLTL